MLRLRQRNRETKARTAKDYRRTASVLSFNHDGLEIARVKRSRRLPWLPVWHVIFVVYLALLIRLIAMADLGPAAYANRMAELQNGTWIERATARIMFMDPVSRSIAVEVREGLRKVRG